MNLGYAIIYVPNVEAALSFYQKAFGLSIKLLHESRQYGELETGATTLAFASEELAVMNGVAIRPNRIENTNAPGIEIALVCNDVEAAYQKALQAGCLSLHPPTPKPWGQTVAFVRDLNGVLVELCNPITD
jgi:lactoylglutathione lyase